MVCIGPDTIGARPCCARAAASPIRSARRGSPSTSSAPTRRRSRPNSATRVEEALKLAEQLQGRVERLVGDDLPGELLGLRAAQQRHANRHRPFAPTAGCAKSSVARWSNELMRRSEGIPIHVVVPERTPDPFGACAFRACRRVGAAGSMRRSASPSSSASAWRLRRSPTLPEHGDAVPDGRVHRRRALRRAGRRRDRAARVSGLEFLLHRAVLHVQYFVWNDLLTLLVFLIDRRHHRHSGGTRPRSGARGASARDRRCRRCSTSRAA